MVAARALLAWGSALSAMDASGSPLSIAPFVVHVTGTSSPCSIWVDGRTVNYDELRLIAHREARPGRAARLDGALAQTPYRCVGGVIYTLQAAGFAKVGFVAAPPVGKR